VNTSPLEQLASERLQLMTACLSTASALRDGLARTTEVLAVREAMEAGTLTEEMVRAFVSSLMGDLKKDESFAHDGELSALAVVLEPLDLPLAEEFLQSLARLQLAEMGMSIRVARECLKHRLHQPNRAKEPVPAKASRSPVAPSQGDGEAGGSARDGNGRPKQAP